MFKRILVAVLGLLVIALVGLGFTAWTPSPARIDTEALLAKAGVYDVTIYRDNWGVPHIYGVRDADVAFGLGFAHSEDDWATLQETLAMSRGTLAQYKGQDGAQTDYLVHLFKIWDLVNARYESDLARETRIVIEAYADGLNLYGAQNPDKVWSGLLPVTGKDIVAGNIFRIPFFFGIDKDFAKIFEPGGFAHDNPVEAAKAALLGAPHLPTGSNAFALAPSRSAEGVTRLLINSHQPFTGPVAWYEVRLKSEEGWDIVGGTFPGSPFIGHGHTGNLGWANTVNAPDLTDVYAMTVNPDNEDQYFFDGEWLDFEVGSADMRVKLWGPFSWVVKRETLMSVYGPTIRLPHGTFAIRHAGRDEVRQVEQFYRLNKARDFDEWQGVMKLAAIPSFNYMYADAQGNIAYLYNGLIPKRREGFDWEGLLPGDTSDTLWTEFMPFEALPFNINPASGFLINANNTPFRATDPSSDLSREDFPEWFGIEKNMTNRSLRALELLSEDPSISFEEFRTYKFDHRYSRGSEVTEMVNAFLGLEAQGDEELAAAQEILRAWDLGTNVDNTYAALPVLTASRVLDWTHPIEDDADKLRALKDVAALLMDRFGRLDPPWGDVNRLRRGTVDLPIDGGPDTLRAIYAGSDLDAQGKITAQAGDTLIYFVEWDQQGQMSSQSIHQFGSATLDETSPHYADQAVLFAAEKFKPVLFDFAELEPNVARAYRPGE